MNEKELLESLVKEVQGIKQELQEVKQNNKIINEKLDNIEKEVNLNTITLDTTLKQCIEVIGDGYQTNFEKMENLHIDSMRSKITQLELLHKLNVSEIDRLKSIIR